MVKRGENRNWLVNIINNVIECDMCYRKKWCKKGRSEELASGKLSFEWGDQKAYWGDNIWSNTWKGKRSAKGYLGWNYSRLKKHLVQNLGVVCLGIFRNNKEASYDQSRVREGKRIGKWFQRSLGLVLNNEAVTMCQIFTSLIGTSLGGKKLWEKEVHLLRIKLSSFLICKKLPPLNPIHLPPQHTPIPVCTLGREKH